MISDTLKTLAELLKPQPRDTVVEVAGRQFLFDDDLSRYQEHGEVRPRPKLEPVVLANIASLREWIASSVAIADVLGIPAGGEVVVRRPDLDGRSRAFFPRVIDGLDGTRGLTEHRVGDVSLEAYTAYMPGDGFNPSTFKYDQFLAWVDHLGEGLEKRRELEAGLASITVAALDSATFENVGAVISVEASAKDGVQTKGVIDKTISAIVPFGDPNFLARITWNLQVRRSKDHGIEFTVRYAPSCGAVESYTQWAITELRRDLPDGWIVLEGA